MNDLPDIKTYRHLFRAATGWKDSDPFHFQTEFATADELPRLVNVPTGAGKTAMAILGWLWRRRFAGESVRNSTPRRLVYCLPMRVLVEQTHDNAVYWLKNLSLLAGDAEFDDRDAKPSLRSYLPSWKNPDKIAVSVLMGGEDAHDWDIYPERDAILIGTQDMLLSRALNRGYGMSRYRWPMQFGLLNNDSLWVFDEIQLMGSGLATTAQLEALRKQFGKFGTVRSVWMSATVNEGWLETADHAPLVQAWTNADRLSIDSTSEAADGKLAAILSATKAVRMVPKKLSSSAELLAAFIRAQHQVETLTLVVLNTVERARVLFESLREAKLIGSAKVTKSKKAKSSGESPQLGKPEPTIHLIHSRFRQHDRERALKALDLKPGVGGMIIVSTQVVEAGVDLSATTLLTELAPWPSLVQRFGRCNRRGDDNARANVFWIDVATSKLNSKAPPYRETELDEARKLMLHPALTNVGPNALKYFAAEVVDNLSAEQKEKLLPRPCTHVIRRHDVHGLFSTEPDLAGGFTDVSPYVRDLDQDTDVLIYWRGFDGQPNDDEPEVMRDEICRVPFFGLSKFLQDSKGRAWQWNRDEERWSAKRPNEIRPGMTLLLRAEQGGYSSDLGWTGSPKHRPERIDIQIEPRDSLRLDSSSSTVWDTLRDHLLDVQADARDLAARLEPVITQGTGGDRKLAHAITDALELASRWHDIGKGHAEWQRAAREDVRRLLDKVRTFLANEPEGPVASAVRNLRASMEAGPPNSILIAKFPDARYSLPANGMTQQDRQRVINVLRTAFRPGLRHEAASALDAWRRWQAGEPRWTGLAVYLVAAHHCKVRTVLRSIYDEGVDVFGIQEADELPALRGWLDEPRTLSLTPRAFGAWGKWETGGIFIVESKSWVGMVAELLGPEVETDPVPTDAVPAEEPRRLGPFRLAYLEAVICAADKRASRFPGKGRRS